jgi:hypothetical protein
VHATQGKPPLLILASATDVSAVGVAGYACMCEAMDQVGQEYELEDWPEEGHMVRFYGPAF